MTKIKVLPDNLANQIAAGEVVERPASVVKELVENAIDAGADRISIDIELGGRRLMRVADNGEGMVRDDAILAFERHATSKIHSLDDLSAISTLGFRGEALASIASVAKVELTTKTDHEIAAARVVVEGGRLVDVKESARDRGTTIEVRDLFYNTPARRKFMRSEATENYHLTSIVTHYALAHPEIAFRLNNNGRDVISVSPARDLRERAFQLFGGSLLESLLPVSGGREHVAEIRGFVSAPRERRTTKDSQYFFVNKRFVRDKTITGGLLEGYRSVLPHGVYPVAFLFIDIPHEEVDVNVHPAKTEVRFRRGEAIKDAIAEAVRRSLANAGIITEPLTERAEEPQIDQSSSPGHEVSPLYQGEMDLGGVGELHDETQDRVRPDPQTDVQINERPVSGEIHADHLPDPSDTFDAARSDELERAAAAIAGGGIPVPQKVDPILPPLNSAVRSVMTVEPDELTASGIRPVSQLHDSFIIAVDDEGLLLVDQHVAHERILFDKYRLSETERSIESQNLLIPETIDLTPAQSEAFGIVEDELSSLGFGVMRLSGRTVAIKSVPTDLPASEVRNLFSEILDGVEADKRGAPKTAIRNDIAASLACKAAVKINMKLSPEKMQWLIDRLLTTSSPTTCPHGRPVILRLSMRDIERLFQRT